MICRSTKNKKEERVASHYFYLLIWSLQPCFDFVWFVVVAKPTQPSLFENPQSMMRSTHTLSVSVSVSLCLSLSWGAGVSWRRRVQTCCCTFVWCSKMYWTVFVSFLCLWWSICNGSIKGKKKKKKGKRKEVVVEVYPQLKQKKSKSTHCCCNGTEERERERESQTPEARLQSQSQRQRERGLKKSESQRWGRNEGRV